MSVRDNVAFGLRIRRTPRHEIEERVRQLLELVQLSGLKRRRPVELSGGQKQRVALARALAIRPRVLLLDQPFAALDTRVRLELREFLRRLHHETRVTTLLVTHDQDEAMELAEHLVVLHRGRVEQAGTPLEVYDRPATAFVAAFVGSATRLWGRVHAGRVRLGESAAPKLRAPEGVADGAPVHAYVRPHGVRIRRPEEGALSPGQAAGDEAVSIASVERLTRVGAQVKLALRLPDGQPVSVVTPRSDFEGLNVREGDRVLVDLAAAKVFLEDYAI